MPKQVSRVASKSFARRLSRSFVVQLRKFPLIADLGTITVPADYVHETQLSCFRARNFGHSDLCCIADGFTDEKFAAVSHQLSPGEKLRVRAFGGGNCLDECLALLRTLQGVHAGAQGLTLVWEQKRHLLPDWWSYASFDERGHLAVDHEAQAAVKGRNVCPDEEWYALEIPHLYHPRKDNSQLLICRKDGMREIRNAFFLFTKVSAPK